MNECVDTFSVIQLLGESALLIHRRNLFNIVDCNLRPIQRCQFQLSDMRQDLFSCYALYGTNIFNETSIEDEELSWWQLYLHYWHRSLLWQTMMPPITTNWQQGYYCMMTSSNGNIFRVTGPLCGQFTGPGEFPTQRPVTRSFYVFFDLRLKKRLSKQPWG